MTIKNVFKHCQMSSGEQITLNWESRCKQTHSILCGRIEWTSRIKSSRWVGWEHWQIRWGETKWKSRSCVLCYFWFGRGASSSEAPAEADPSQLHSRSFREIHWFIHPRSSVTVQPWSALESFNFLLSTSQLAQICTLRLSSSLLITKGFQIGRSLLLILTMLI